MAGKVREVCFENSKRNTVIDKYGDAWVGGWGGGMKCAQWGRGGTWSVISGGKGDGV